MFEHITGYGSLFFGAFLASSLVPLNSEILLLIAISKNLDPWISLMVATLGNCLGGITNYLIGRLGNPNWLKRVGLNHEKIDSFELRIQKYGYWLAFFSWIPFVGDPLTAALGFFRVPWMPVVIFSAVGKFLRYLLLILPFL
jgi:membrane protein YqaA with SNARE-associated domain